MKRWHVYMLECSDGSLYTGVTNDLEARIAKHKAGLGAKYTRSHGVKKLVYSEISPTKSTAMKREKEIQSLSRKQKLELIDP